MSKYLSEPGGNFPTLVELLRWRAKNQPNRRAYTFLVDGETKEVHLTYQELDRQARVIAAELQSLGVTGERALLLYPPGLEFISAFFGCLYAGVVAIPAYPPDPSRLDRTLPRLQAIIADAEPAVVLTTSRIKSMLTLVSGQNRLVKFLTGLPIPKKLGGAFLQKLATLQTHGLHSLTWVVTEKLSGEASFWQTPIVTSDSVAYLQYTSGSTATPKGVIVSHANVLHNLRMMERSSGLDSEPILFGWLPLYHDLGLVGHVLYPLYAGGIGVLMSPVDFLRKPIRWLQGVSRYRAQVTSAPNFAYDLCVRKITPEEKATLDLSCIQMALVGAEPIRVETVRRFVDTFAACGFRWEMLYSCYGLAEATLSVCGSLKTDSPVVLSVQEKALLEGKVVIQQKSSEDSTKFVGCGRPLVDQKIVIVDPETFIECPPNQVGEIWLAGPNVALGYWNRQEESEQTFQASLSDSREGTFLRSGDLGFMKQGELFVTGRLKDLIIIRGRNHYPQDIELTVEKSHSALRSGCVAAFSVEIAGEASGGSNASLPSEERLVVVAEVYKRRKLNVNEVIAAIRQAVSEQHELQLYAIQLLKAKSLPKTSSGKLQRYACKIGFLNRSLDVVGEWGLTDNRPEEPFREPSSQQNAQDVSPKVTTETIQAWLVTKISQQLSVAPQEIDVREPVARYGLDSMAAVSLSRELENWLGRSLSPTLAYDYPSIEAMARYLASEANVYVAKSSAVEKESQEPIAIIGLGCRFPGAKNAQAFWELLRDGVDAITEVPAERWEVERFYDSRPMTPGKMNTRWGGFLSEIDLFDASFFGISPREVISMDPQQRLLLEVAYEALEDAGQASVSLRGTRTGVFIGISHSEYGWLQVSNSDHVNGYWSTGNALSIAANRISYLFNFQGPSLAIDTACSSSLVAVHLACRSLWNGESTLALAGGTNLILTPTVTINFSQGGGTSPTGRCKAFDAQANGMVRSEGVGIVVLKPLSRALADGDSIYAVIRGSAINQDGSTNGIVAPNQHAQEAVLREAYRIARVSPHKVQYVEAHGTGTVLGDPIEAKALGRVLNTESRTSPCVIGSVKSNIGHAEAAAGIAGLIKVALALKHQEIPPSLHFSKPNPYIPFDELALRVPQTLEPWPKNGPRYAGVSAFGFGGTNAHVVLQEAPAKREHKGAENADQAQLLPLSAHSPEALRTLVQAYKEYLDSETAKSILPEVCYTASLRRNHHDHRLAIVFRSEEELKDRLEAFLQDEARAGMSSGRLFSGHRPKIVFVFSGQRPQAWSVERSLLEQEPVRNTLMQCDELFQQYADWSLFTELTDASRFSSSEIEISQCAMFALQVSLAALWRSWGIEPDAVVGHSFGEIAAAYVAGALSLKDAVQVIFHRSHLLQEGIQQAPGQGAMAAVEMSMAEAKRILEGYEDRLSIAVNNSPTSVVLSGDADALHDVIESLRQKNIFCRVFDALGAGHSSQIEPLQSKLVQVLPNIQAKTALIPIYSTVTGQVTDGQEFDAAYWGRHIREPVLFADAINQLSADGYDAFLELTPYPPILFPAISQCLLYWGLSAQSPPRIGGKKGLVLPALRRRADEYTHMRGSLGALYASGYPVDWRCFYPDGGRWVRLPSYPWQGERFWIEDEKTAESHDSLMQRPLPIRKGMSKHPLLGQHLNSAVQPGMHFWEMELGTQLFPYLKDHRVQGAVLLPTTAYLEMALAATVEAFGAGHYILEKVSIDKALFLSEGNAKTVQLVISGEISSEGPGDSASFQLFSRPVNDTQQQASWILHASGMIRSSPQMAVGDHSAPKTILDRCPEIISGIEYYQVMQKQGAEYGPSFQGIKQLWRQEGEAIAELCLTETVELEAMYYQIHPALLDACLQVLAGTLYGLGVAEGDLYLPVSVGSIRLYGRPRPDGELWGHALLRSSIKTDLDTIAGDVFLLNENGQVIVEVLGLSLQRVGHSKQYSMQNIENWFYEIQWEAKARPPQGVAPLPIKGSWIIFADSSGIGQTLAEQLEARGESCFIVSPSENYKRLEEKHYQLNPARKEDFQQLLKDTLTEVKPPCRGVIHLWSLEAIPPAKTTLVSLQKAQVLGCVSVLYLVQALAGVNKTSSPRLWLVTSGAQAVKAEQKAVSIAQSPLWGLGRVISFEHPELRSKMVDLSLRSKADLSASGISPEVASLFQELWSNDREDHIALRGNTRYVARLIRRAVTQATLALFSSKTSSENKISVLPASEGYTVFRSDGTYLITGGLGGLGLTVAKWMVQQGARHLVLMGRSDPRAATQETLQVMERAGAKVFVAKADVTVEQQVAGVLAEIGPSMPPLRGIVHAAGTLDDGLLLQLNQKHFRSVMAPKMDGAWNLHALTLKTSLDFFVLFSSVASLLGSPGQGNYVAANGFLDALAHYRQTQGLPALSINWGPWAQVGGLARAGRGGGERLALRGFESLTPELGIEALDRLLQHSIIEDNDLTQVGVMPVNWSRVYQVYPMIKESALLSQLVREEADMRKKAGTLFEKEGLTRDALLTYEPEERQQVLESYIRKQVATTLGISLSKLDIHQPLNTMGIDSLMALEMKNRIELELGVAVPIVKFLEGANVAELTILLLNQITEPDYISTMSLPTVRQQNQGDQKDDPSNMINGKNVADILSGFHQLSDDEVESLLLSMLSEKENNQ